MAIILQDNIQTRAPKPIDDRYGPWTTLNEALTNVPSSFRYNKLTVNVDGVEYWFKDGITDEDLVVKQYGSEETGDTLRSKLGITILSGDNTGDQDLSEFAPISEISKWEQSPDIVTNSSIKYGRLYNWYAATDSRNIAPVGWHVPTDAEWQTLINYLGGESIAGGKLKEVGTTHWVTPNTGATNESSFTALPSGKNTAIGFNGIYGNNYLWSITEGYEGYAKYRTITYYLSEIIDGYIAKIQGQSVRLIKDNGTNEGDVVIDGDTYNAITIGTQVWLQQNLAVKHYQNGDLIGSDFSGTAGAVAAYNNDETNVYNIVTISDTTHIQPKSSKRIHANIIDDLHVYEEVGIAQTIVDNLNMGDIITHNTSEFVPKVFSPVFTTSTSQIALNCLNDVQYDSNNGTTDTTIAFSNLPLVSTEKILIINNLRATAFNLVIPDSFVSGGITYTVKSMIQSPVYINISGSAEFSFLFIFVDSTHCEIRITGGTNV